MTLDTYTSTLPGSTFGTTHTGQNALEGNMQNLERKFLQLLA